MKPDYVYVASSWRNAWQPAVCAVLRAADINHYDFKNPSPGNHGFHWSEVMPGYVSGSESADVEEYRKALTHPIAEDGFARDFEALQKADVVLLVLPCGRSAHLELGWAVGAGKRTIILLDGPVVVPELMYKMVDHLVTDYMELLNALGVED